VILVLNVDPERQAAAERALRPRYRLDTRTRILRNRPRKDGADRDHAAVGKVKALRNSLPWPRLAVWSKLAFFDPLSNQHEDARPGGLGHVRVVERARDLALVIHPLSARPWFRCGLRVAHEVKADRRPDDFRLAHQVEMIEITRLNQVFKRQAGKIHVVLCCLHRLPSPKVPSLK
jgi:hypothetical protein